MWVLTPLADPNSLRKMVHLNFPSGVSSHSWSWLEELSLTVEDLLDSSVTLGFVGSLTWDFLFWALISAVTMDLSVSSTAATKEEVRLVTQSNFTNSLWNVKRLLKRQALGDMVKKKWSQIQSNLSNSYGKKTPKVLRKLEELWYKVYLGTFLEKKPSRLCPLGLV